MIYPIVKIPELLEKVSKALPKLPVQPVIPLKPQKEKVPTKPTMRIEPASGCSSMLWGIGILIVFALPMMAAGVQGVGILILGAIVGVPIFLFGYREQERHDSYNYYNERRLYEERLAIYEQDIQKINDCFDEEFKKYEILYQVYLYKLGLYEKECERLRTTSVIEKVRLDYVKQILNRTSKPILHNNTNNILSGVSEDYFFQKLQNYFGENIVKGYTIPNVGYLPDIILYEKNTGLCIDIEIDEPYVGSTGVPIHYSESLIDIERNKKFLKAGWLVIRFAEEQVVKYPMECCDFIIETIEKITLGYVNATSFAYSKRNSKLIPVKQWTKDDAHKLAFARYRNTYLPKNLVEKISIENIEWFANNSTDKIISSNTSKNSVETDSNNICE